MKQVGPRAVPTPTMLTIHPGYYSDRWLREAFRTLSEDVEDAGYSPSEQRLLHLRRGLVASELALRGRSEEMVSRALEYRLHSARLPDGAAPPAEIRELQEASPGRLPVPRNSQEFWAQHKYSVMARDPEFYRQTGRLLSRTTDKHRFDDLVERCTRLLYRRPPEGRLRNAVHHMWGYVSDLGGGPHESHPSDLLTTVDTIRRRASEYRVHYLWTATGLSDLDLWARYYTHAGG